MNARRISTLTGLHAPPTLVDAGSATREAAASLLQRMPLHSTLTVDPAADGPHAGRSFIRGTDHESAAWYSPRPGGRTVYLSSLQLAALRIVHTDIALLGIELHHGRPFYE